MHRWSISAVERPFGDARLSQVSAVPQNLWGSQRGLYAGSIIFAPNRGNSHRDGTTRQRRLRSLGLYGLWMSSGKVINVANGMRITLNQLLAELKDLTGTHDVEAEYLEPRVGDVRHSLADISMARELLGYESKVDLREGLQRTIDWWKSSRFARQD